MKKVIVPLLTVVVMSIMRSEACFDPNSIYYGGIVLNNGETIDYELLEERAGDAAAYIKECFLQDLTEETGGEVTVTEETVTDSADSQTVAAKMRKSAAEPETIELCSYKLRSAYQEDAMVFIGHVQGMFDLFGDVPRLIVYFPVDSNNIPTTEEKAAAVAAELHRFADLGIIAVSEETIARAQELLAVQQGQYWAAQDSVLAFNMWFDVGGTYGVRSANGVKGVWGVSGCGSGVAYELPEKGFTTAVQSGVSITHRNAAPVHTEINGSGITLHYSTITANSAVLAVYTMQARVVREIALARRSSSLRLEGMTPGCYLLSILEAGKILQRGRMTVYR
jgi:hypothetical protein